MNLMNKINDYIHTHCKKSKDTTIPNAIYKDGKYKISRHAVDRMNERKITKGEVHVNLYTTPKLKTLIEYDSKNRPAYIRYGFNKVRTVINPKSNYVASVRRYKDKEYNKSLKKWR